MFLLFSVTVVSIFYIIYSNCLETSYMSGGFVWPFYSVLVLLSVLSNQHTSIFTRFLEPMSRLHFNISGGRNSSVSATINRVQLAKASWPSRSSREMRFPACTLNPLCYHFDVDLMSHLIVDFCVLVLQNVSNQVAISNSSYNPYRCCSGNTSKWPRHIGDVPNRHLSTLLRPRSAN